MIIIPYFIAAMFALDKIIIALLLGFICDNKNRFIKILASDG